MSSAELRPKAAPVDSAPHGPRQPRNATSSGVRSGIMKPRPPLARPRIAPTAGRDLVKHRGEDLERLVEGLPRDIQRRHEPDDAICAPAELDDQPALDCAALHRTSSLAARLTSDRVDQLNAEHQ